jgi:hypothetical protein
MYPIAGLILYRVGLEGASEGFRSPVYLVPAKAPIPIPAAKIIFLRMGLLGSYRRVAVSTSWCGIVSRSSMVESRSLGLWLRRVDTSDVFSTLPLPS